MNKRVETWLVLFTLLLGAQRCQDDFSSHHLEGHWHVLPIDPNPGFDGYSTIDVLNDSVAVFDRGVLDKGEGFWGTIDHAERQLQFGGECLILDFNYKITDDTTLLLSQMRYDGSGEWSFEAVKCSGECSSPEEDYFKHSKVRISLPVAGDPDKAYAYDYLPRYLLRIAYIGRLDQPLADVYGQTANVLQLGDKIANPSDLKAWKENHLLKVPEQARDRTHTALLCDTSTTYESIRPILDELQSLGERNVLFGVKASSDSFSIDWIPVALTEDLDSILARHLK